jgi:hypothetical protein
VAETDEIARNERALASHVTVSTYCLRGTKQIGGTCVKPEIRGDTEIAETAYPYATHLDIKFDPLTLIDVSSLAKAVTDQWYN